MENRFKQAFGKYVCEGDEIHAEIDGFDVYAKVVRDDIQDKPDQRDDGFWPSLLPENPGYLGEVPRHEYEAALKQAHAIMKAWKNNEWFYCGIVLRVEYEGVELNDHAAALWGIECNYPVTPADETPNSYLTEVANEMLEEALTAGKEKLQAMSINESTTAMRDFVKQIARLTMDGEEVNGREFILEGDDAVSTLHGLIDQARDIQTQMEAV